MTTPGPLQFTPDRTIVDGVPVYSSDALDLPPTITLLFRAGTVDESLGVRGITHLVEHLAVRELRTAPYGFNAPD